jgi:hypothetical protein
VDDDIAKFSFFPFFSSHLFSPSSPRVEKNTAEGRGRRQSGEKKDKKGEKRRKKEEKIKKIHVIVHTTCHVGKITVKRGFGPG